MTGYGAGADEAARRLVLGRLSGSGVAERVLAGGAGHADVRRSEKSRNYDDGDPNNRRHTAGYVRCVR
ncbi:hypothetical protein GLX30_06570 [Streptomyces sp. Tu 2975]|uniref:hypothetical protein n=1 Tax=Streptomyces sp. Tu 2975 TaxID=2676871 RepID=UPI00135B6E5C|nr:hypothetical protein [Streptomyces sp. Tu 2975]QIP83789.1 hypothetical protein GLX30_06570 [Streptomyces sp. Tu 2975]